MNGADRKRQLCITTTQVMHLCFAEVEVHAMVDNGDCLQVKVTHPRDL